MTPDQIAAALGAARRVGTKWRCRCPLHGGQSLVLEAGTNGRLLLKCWGGCDTRDVLAELRRIHLLDGPVTRFVAGCPPDYENEAAKTARALKIWDEADEAAGTIVETYLLNRGIQLDELPRSLRFHPRCPHPLGSRHPALV